jgi:hypothetical protein
MHRTRGRGEGRRSQAAELRCREKTLAKRRHAEIDEGVLYPLPQ